MPQAAPFPHGRDQSMKRLYPLLAVLSCALPSAVHAQASTEWVEPSGHRVVQLSREPGSSNFYFHQNAYTADGDKLVISGRKGLSAVDLKTHAVDRVVEGPAGNAVVGKKSREIFYLRGSGVYATHLDSHATRKIAELPSQWRRGAGLAVNADETLLAGCATLSTGTAAPPKPAVRGKKTSLAKRLDANLPMVLYTIQIKTGEVKEVHHATDWLNHVQFSPSDPTLIMFCHEGPWHKVDRIWTIRTDGTGLTKVHTRTMDMEIAGHEFFSADGKIIWYDLQTPRGKEFWLAGKVLATGEAIRYRLDREHWSVHYNAAPDGKHFAGDGGGPKSVAAPGNGQAIYLFTAENGKLKAEKLVDLSEHDYSQEPNVTFTHDGKWIVFRSNKHGPRHVYAVEVKRSQ